MTKITIISGFLGAGKTTLIKKLITSAYPGEKLVLIENEFGEIGIDGKILEDQGIEVSELNSGCICCSLSGDYRSSIVNLIEWLAPDRILIEPSGVGMLSDIIKATKTLSEMEDFEEETVISGIVTVVDALRCQLYLSNFGEFYTDQITNSNCIVLSRTDGISAQELNACVDAVRGLNWDATIITTPLAVLSAGQLRAAMEADDSLSSALSRLSAELEHEPHSGHDQCGDHCHEHHHGHEHHHAGEVFESWGVETPKTFSANAFPEKLVQLDDREKYGFVVRAKGILQDTNGSWFEFNFVPDAHEVRECKPCVTGRICVIGSKLNKAALASLFDQQA